jgi:hypothetical protein
MVFIRCTRSAADGVPRSAPPTPSTGPPPALVTAVIISNLPAACNDDEFGSAVRGPGAYTNPPRRAATDVIHAFEKVRQDTGMAAGSTPSTTADMYEADIPPRNTTTGTPDLAIHRSTVRRISASPRLSSCAAAL